MKRRSFVGAGVAASLGASAARSAPVSQSPFEGPFNIATGGRHISITNGDEPFLNPHAVLQVINEGEISCGFRVQAYWANKVGEAFQNHDASLFEVFNTTEFDSLNRSWAGSFCNAYNKIPLGTTDHGTRVGVVGWATSAANGKYVHEGTLDTQVGVYGTAGFQAAGSGPNAVVLEAVGVRGMVLNDSPGSTVKRAYAAQFVSTATDGKVEHNIAVYASAANGTEDNYSFFGKDGRFYNAEEAQFGAPIRIVDETRQSDSSIAARAAGNSFEFGHPDREGYASNLGATVLAGFPFLAFNAEADADGNKFKTRGKPGVLVWSDLDGSLLFGRVDEPNASGQMPIESARFDSNGSLVLAERPTLPAKPPLSPKASGKEGEIAYDDEYFYVCVADNRWKRFALSSWDE